MVRSLITSVFLLAAPLIALVNLQCSLAAGDETLSQFSRFDEVVEPLIARMTLEEKVGQMTQAEADCLDDPNEIKELFLGSVLSGGDSDPANGNSLKDWTDRYDLYQSKAMQSRLRIPLIYGVDAVHGHNNIANAVIFPHNIGLGCTDNPKLVEEIARLTAKDVRASGIQWAFAPCVTVPRDKRWGRTYEGFSEDPEVVARLGVAAVRGLQSNDLSNPHSVLGCAKHFIADGGTVPELRESHHGELDAGIRYRLDQGDVQLDENSLREIHLKPYKDAIEAGVGSIMPSYSSWNGIKCTGNHYLLTELLKEELGFEGFLISDFAAIDQVDPDYKTAIAKSINAGIDMGMVPWRHKEFHTLLCELVREEKVPLSRINDAVKRILRLKAAMGMLDDSYSYLADRSLHDSFSSSQHQQIARKAVRDSIVVLKNEDQTLPLQGEYKKIVVCGSAAKDLGQQCGGWTISWQGRKGQQELKGTTIFEGISNVAGKNTSVEYSATGKKVAQADLAILVVGEEPYAEGLGDDFDLTLNERDRELIQHVHDSEVPMVLVVISGRPLVMTEEIAKADAVLAAWLPGTEGSGVADIIFGNYAPTGRLSFTWPDAISGYKSQQETVLFPIGYGLNFRHSLADKSTPDLTDK